MIFYSLFVIMFFGGTLVFYSLSPYYGALGLVVVALSGCIFVSLVGVPFMALILILIYMGGMLVVFVYSTAISAERYPTVSIDFKEIVILSLLIISWVLINFDLFVNGEISSWLSVANPGLLGSGELYNEMGWYLIGGGYILLVALIVALIITYGSDFNVLKAL
uniref:NADH-ubiquinone oxidoreductase chain 6 n=1 Tax=Astropecten polyacanthus TaxID=60560 RepID=Q5KSP6_ASTPO|nr:NADH dehydrogenase subunit 6 [Astropecten polyacanthus]BAD86707.1 NADH dehydrogenase subunit 6 [Astropecten polyacanthus]